MAGLPWACRTARAQQTLARGLVASLLSALSLAACSVPEDRPAEGTENTAVPLPPMRVFGEIRAEPPSRANADMVRDFLDLSFALESGRALPVLSRFERPITIRMSGPVPPTAPRDLKRLVSRLRSEAGLQVSLGDIPGAEITVEFIPSRNLRRAVPYAACFVVPNVSSWAEYRRAPRARVDWANVTLRERAAVFIPSDAAPQEIRDCLNEELAQAIGPLNDLYRLPDSVFNDDNMHTVLTGFDMLMLRAYYAPELRSGMTREEAARRLPAVLDRLNPRGRAVPPRPVAPTPRAYVDAIQRALGPGSSPAQRRRAAAEAVAIAARSGWRDGRAAFAWLSYGRVVLDKDPETAFTAFLQSARIARADPLLELHAAHAELQLALFALANGDPRTSLALTERAIPPATRDQNAALLANLLMVRAEALEELGRVNEARAARLDSLGWARYGFGAQVEIAARLVQRPNADPTAATDRAGP
ncbi:DUF2927 domain-containing protein [Albidovulum inexpectatum]|uniref:DUF2927 domain-containing protein n=1 Tax=Albidovulum inexpectatum TaxID=196587 RepID=UPI001FE2828B|nr:DUF2927 domain-containing protein [Albidovulum inexpectatum]